MSLSCDNKANQYVSRFNMWKRKTAMSYIEMAKVVVEAKDSLSKEGFSEFTQLIGYSTTDSFISKLYRIGLQSEIFEQHIDSLPSSFTTLYALTTVGEVELSNLFEQQRIRPSLRGHEVEQLIKIQKRYGGSKTRHLERCAGTGEIIDIDEPLQRLEPIALRIDESVTKAQLAQFLRQLELLTRFDGVNVTIPISIHKRISQQEQGGSM